MGCGTDKCRRTPALWRHPKGQTAVRKRCRPGRCRAKGGAGKVVHRHRARGRAVRTSRRQRSSRARWSSRWADGSRSRAQRWCSCQSPIGFPRQTLASAAASCADRALPSSATAIRVRGWEQSSKGQKRIVNSSGPALPTLHRLSTSPRCAAVDSLPVRGIRYRRPNSATHPPVSQWDVAACAPYR